MHKYLVTLESLGTLISHILIPFLDQLNAQETSCHICVSSLLRSVNHLLISSLANALFLGNTTVPLHSHEGKEQR